jgi:hypothetical protein
MHKTHRNSQNCRNTIAKKQRDKKNLKNGTLDGFLRPRPAFIASTVQPIPLIHSLPVAEGAFTALPSAVVSVAQESKLLNRIQKIVKNLPDSVPIASSQDRLAVFSYDPCLIAETTKNGDDLWEDTLNSFLKKALGWGGEEDMEDMVRRGEKGMDGIMHFVRYFINERGVSEALFEGKLNCLLDAADKM